MTTLKDYQEDIEGALEPVANCLQNSELIAIAYEISNLTTAVYKLIDVLESKK